MARRSGSPIVGLVIGISLPRYLVDKSMTRCRLCKKLDAVFDVFPIYLSSSTEEWFFFYGNALMSSFIASLFYWLSVISQFLYVLHFVNWSSFTWSIWESFPESKEFSSLLSFIFFRILYLNFCLLVTQGCNMICSANLTFHIK